MTQAPKTELFHTVTEEVLEQLRTLLHAQGHGALATLSPEDGFPQATRIALAFTPDHVPVSLVSMLAVHTPALRNDPRCSLMVGEVGRGDPLAHKRAMIRCKAVFISREDPRYDNIRALYLHHQPKAKLYVDLGDFSFVALEPIDIRLNGGFGKAYQLTGDQLTGRAPI